MLNALAVLQPSNELTQLLSLLFSIEDRAKLYYISGGKTGGGDTPTPTPKPDGGGDDSTPSPTPDPTPTPDSGGGGDDIID